jgi:hypothetical protein
MSQTNDPSRTAGISTSCYVVPFDPGQYGLVLIARSQGRGDGLPAARISLPPGPSGRRETVSINTFRGDGWLGLGDRPTLVRVVGERSPIMATLYWPGTDGPGGAPQIQIHRFSLDPSDTPPPDRPEPASPTIDPVRPPPPPAAARFQDPEVIAHVQDRGDIEGRIGDWIGMRGSGLAIEGFSLTPRLGLRPEDLDYRAMIGRDRMSPWLPGGQFCGSRGLGLPLLGFSVRLRGPAAARYELACFARFVDGAEAGPFAQDQICHADNAAPLEAFQIILRPRGF